VGAVPGGEGRGGRRLHPLPRECEGDQSAQVAKAHGTPGTALPGAKAEVPGAAAPVVPASHPVAAQP
jgi:hypothetical protein